MGRYVAQNVRYQAFVRAQRHDVTFSTSTENGILLRWSDHQESSGALRQSADGGDDGGEAMYDEAVCAYVSSHSAKARRLHDRDSIVTVF